MDLLIRAGQNDHLVLEGLCAPATAGLWPTRSLPLTGIVADATTILDRPALRGCANDAGLPLIIDPLTPLLQDEQAPGGPWSRLPYGDPQKRSASDYSDLRTQDRLVEEVIEFQRENGATILVPPYVYADKLDGAWFELGLSLLDRTARHLHRQSVDLPVAPIFAASLHEFGPQAAWVDGVDRFRNVAGALNLRHVNLSFSWSAQRDANYNALALLLTTARHVATKHRALAWRQGLYGAAMTAAGLEGYETGAGQLEACHYPRYAAARRPKSNPDDTGGGGAGAFVYLRPFGRSLKRDAAEILLRDDRLRGSLVCTDEACCPDGATSMTTKWREHAVRSRAREVQELAKMPATSWRLNRIARDAERNASTARHASELLRKQGVKGHVPDETFRALSQVADEVRLGPGSQAA